MSSPPGPAAPRRVVFAAQGEAAIEAFDLAEPAAGEVLMETALSLMSTGTENVVLTGDYDADTHWHRWVRYPFYPGYAAVGRIRAIGAGVKGLGVGSRVACRVGHRSHALVPSAACFRIPDEVPFAEAVWFALAKIAFRGVTAAGLSLGDEVLVIGAGPIGQMAVRWARAAGVGRLIVADQVPERLRFALAGGASAALAGEISDLRTDIREANGGRLPRVVVDSTGNAAVFRSALGLAADRGTVVLLGDTGRPDRQHLTSDLVVRALTLAGAHDTQDSGGWNNATITQLFFELARSGRFPLRELNTHCFAPVDCRRAYELANGAREKTMGIVFDWSPAGLTTL